MLFSLNNDKPVSASSGVAAPAPENVSRTSRSPRAAEVQPAGGAERKTAADRRQIENAINTLNRFTQMAAQDVRFSIDEDSGKTIVKVVDVATQTVLRQIPNAEALSLSRSLDKMQGLLVRDSA